MKPLTRDRIERFMRALGVMVYTLRDDALSIVVHVPARVCAVVLMFFRRELSPIYVISIRSLNLL